MRKISLSALVLIGSLGVANVAGAGCCDDFWSCAAAVATAGVSCQIQGLIDSVTQLKQTVETLINTMSSQVQNVIAQAQQGVTNAATDMKQVRAEASEKVKSNADEARALANPTVAARPMLPKNAAMSQSAAQAAPALKGAAAARAKVAVAPAPKPADPAALKDAMKRADQYLQGEVTAAAAPASRVNQFADAAVAAAARHLQAAQRISTELAMAPLNLLRDSLLDLLAHPERLFDPSAQINADVQRVATQVPAMFEKITNEITQEALAELNQGTKLVQQIQESASAGDAIVGAMKKANESQLQSDLDELNRLLPRQATAVALKPVFTLAPAVVSVNQQRLSRSLDHALPAKLPIVIQQRAAASSVASKWQSILAAGKAKQVIEPAATQKVERDLGQMYAGKKGADVAKKKNELLAEAKKRFAKDPKTLAKVLEYIEAHSPKA